MLTGHFGELPTDLQGLCHEPCHIDADEERKLSFAMEREEKRRQARYESGLDGYLTKRYGEDAALKHYLEPDRLKGQFHRFLKRHSREHLN